MARFNEEAALAIDMRSACKKTLEDMITMSSEYTLPLETIQEIYVRSLDASVHAYEQAHAAYMCGMVGREP